MTDAERSAIAGRDLLLYDGVCPMCNGAVKFVALRDTRGRLWFAPLEGEVGREVLRSAGLTEQPESMVLVRGALTPGQRVYLRSDAAVQVLSAVGGFWRFAGRLLRAVPRPLRDRGYRLVARLRYALFGRYRTCPIPPPELRARMVGAY